MRRIQIIVAGLIPLALLVYGIWLGFEWGVMRVYVPQDKALIVVNKFGKDLPEDRVVVPKEDNHFKGVREEVLGPGRYFFNPVEYSTELVDLVVIPVGDPQHWEFDSAGNLKNLETAPQVGLVTLKEGKSPPADREVVDEGFKGLQKEVLTPGVYKINPYRMEVRPVPAVIVPPGSVGVKTQLVDTNTIKRGIRDDVLQPGIYYLNPRMVKVTIVPVGYDQITLDHSEKTAVSFYTNDGYAVEADFTVVWGREPKDAPNIVATIGNVDRVTTNVIEPAMKAACQNEGAKYSAKELIQGTTRSKFQDDLSASLEKQVSGRSLHVLLALIRNITIKDTSGKDATNGLLATIQRANIEVEKELTNKQKTETAMTSANLEQALKLVDVAKETVSAETNQKVANIMADGQKKAAEIAAQRELDVASIALEMAKLDAERYQILGKANAEIDRLKRDAEAKGAKLLIDAFGSPQAYNLYTFAQNFQPTDLRMIFAGPGTFWTDLKSFQDVGAVKVMQQTQKKE